MSAAATVSSPASAAGFLPVSFRAPVLPWAADLADQRRFGRIRSTVLGSATAICLVMLLSPRPPAEAPRATEAVLSTARLVLPPKPLQPAKPPPAPTQAERAAPLQQPQLAQAPKPKDVPAPEARRPDRPQDKPQASAVPAARDPVPGKPPGENLEAARRAAQGVGLLAMKSELASLQGAPTAVQLRQDIKPGRGIGTGSGPGVGAGTEQGVPTRALITSNASGGSGGINTAAYSRDTGGGGLAGRATALVEGTIGGGGGGGPGGGLGTGGKGDGVGNGSSGAKGGTLTKGGSGKASRSIEDVRLVFERQKGAIYAIYNRALRDEPALQGKVVLELKISPSGQVIGSRIVSSELHASELEAKLLARIGQFDFGAKDVEQMVVTWPVDFLPS